MATLLQNYSESEKTAYLSAIASLASADREASTAEIEFLQGLAQQAGLSDGAAQQVVAAAKDSTNETVKQNLDALKGSDLRFSLITDLISFARADGAYANDEEAMVGKMAAYLGVNPEQKQALETVVDQAAQVPHSADDPAKKGFFDGIGDKLSNVGIPKTALLAGLLGVVAPMVLSRMGGGGSNQQSNSGGGLLGGSMGGLLGGAARSGMGGLLGGLLGGLGGGGGAPSPHMGGGGLGSMMSVLGGLGGVAGSQPRSTGGGGLFGSGMGGLLGGLFGR